jgi:hypothetical protein
MLTRWSFFIDEMYKCSDGVIVKSTDCFESTPIILLLDSLEILNHLISALKIAWRKSS